MKRLHGKAAIVTGGTQGIGRGCALRLAAEGARVLVCSRSSTGVRETLDAVASVGGECVHVTADVGVKDQAVGLVHTALARFGRLDILVNNAQAQTPWLPLEQKTDEMFQLSLGSGLYATLWLMQAAFEPMREQGGGRIVNFGSRRGAHAASRTADYNANKEALRALTRTAAREWGRHGILVNVVLPASETDAAKAYFAANPEVAQRVRDSVPLKRLGDPEADVGALVAGLASDDACFITGESFFVDGGMHLKRPE
jgi:NAD(P)-dependent dehydrogenase (short-subunit alcohol dehydrogenase family)